MSDILSEAHSVSRGHLSEAAEAYSVSYERISAVVIDEMSSKLLELLDQYDAVALELGRMQIPLKKSWAHCAAQSQTVATARLKEMVELHDRANQE